MKRAWLPPAAVLAAIAVAAWLFWPGVPMYDTVAQYNQVIGGAVDDWHPPIMVRLWQALHGIAPGTAPIFALQVALCALGFALIAAALARTGRPLAAIAVAVLALSPLMLGWQMVVLKDAQMLGALVAAVGITAFFWFDGRRLPGWAAVPIGVLIVYATLVRANAVFATVPLAVMLCSRRGHFAGAAIAGLGLVTLVALSPLINHRLLGAEPSGVAKAQPMFDLAGIAVRSDASDFTQAERAQIVQRNCAKAFFWDPLTDPEGCATATQRLHELPASRLYAMLGRAALTHPIAYASHRLAHWNSTERWLVAPGLPDAAPPVEAEPNALGLRGPRSPAAAWWQQAAAAEAATPLGWPITWTVVALLLVPLAWSRRGEPSDALALALLASAVTLEASFLVVSIASDLRYHLWPMTASALALILLSHHVARRHWAIGAAALAAIIAAGLVARSNLPRAPDSYEGMIHAASG